MLIESKTSGWKSLQLFCLPLLILLCSKYYFLFGFFPGTWRPIAPTWLVLTRDFIFFGFLSWGFFQISSLGIKKNFGQVWLENLRAIKTFYILLSFACLAIIIQLFGIKTLAEISQHYVRNAFLPILIFPMVLLYAGAYPKLLDLLPTFRIFMFLSVIVSLLQIFIWHDLMWINRPTGLMGDPLLNSVFILIGLLSFEFEKTVQRTLFAILILPAGFVLYQANSLSAVFAFLMGLVLTAVFGWRQFSHLPGFKKTLTGAVGLVLLMFLMFFSFSYLPQNLRREGADAGFAEKISALLNSPSHYSVVGRLRSNAFPFELCEKRPEFCLTGDWQTENYYRLDSIWASLLVNWGIFFLLAYLALFLILPMTRIRHLDFSRRDHLFAVIIFFNYWIFSIFNAGFYKYPFNLIFYISVALLFHFSNRSTKA